MMIFRREAFILLLAFDFFAVRSGSWQEITGRSVFSITPVIQNIDIFANFKNTLVQNSNVIVQTGILEVEKFRLIRSYTLDELAQFF